MLHHVNTALAIEHNIRLSDNYSVYRNGDTNAKRKYRGDGSRSIPAPAKAKLSSLTSTMRIVDIADMHRVSESTVKKWLADYGLKTRIKKLPGSTITAIQEMAMMGLPNAEIARQLNLTPSRVGNVIRKITYQKIA